MFTLKKNTFIHQGRIKLIKLSRTILFQINAVLMNFLIIKESWKRKCINFHKKYELFST